MVDGTPVLWGLLVVAALLLAYSVLAARLDGDEESAADRVPDRKSAAERVPDRSASANDDGRADESERAPGTGGVAVDAGGGTGAAESVGAVIGGQTTAGSDMTMTTPDGRTFTGTELEVVERAREHSLDHPAAGPRELVAVGAPANSVPPDEVEAYWRDVLRPGIAALSDVDVDRVEGNDGSDATVPAATDGVDRDATPTDDATDGNADATDADGSNSDATDDPATPAASEDGPAVETAALDTGTLGPRPEANDGDGNDGDDGDAEPLLDLDGAFEVQWVDRDEAYARVAGRGYTATFAVVDRDGDLGVRPLDAGYRTDDGVPRDWYVDAASALEDALPDAYAALDAPDSAWTAAVETAASRAAGGASRLGVETVEVTDDGHLVVVHGDGDRRAEVLVSADGAEFVDPDVRLEHGEYWAAMAVDAADRHVRFD